MRRWQWLAAVLGPEAERRGLAALFAVRASGRLAGCAGACGMLAGTKGLLAC